MPYPPVDPSGRHFLNPALSSTSILQTISPQEAETHLNKSLENLINVCPPTLPWKGTFRKGAYVGLFSGPTSIAFLFLWLSRRQPDLSIFDISPKEYCGLYLNLEQDKYPPEETPISGCSLNHEYMSYNAIKACHTWDLKYVKNVIDRIDKFSTNPEYIEVLFGRAGVLSLLRMIKWWFPGSKELIEPAIKNVIEYCLSKNPWVFGVGTLKRFWGAGHGDIGIIANIVLSDPSYADKVKDRLIGLLDLQLENGNWNTKEVAEGEQGEDLVQFCHGAPGFVWCLVPLREYYPDLRERIDEAIRRARNLIWEKGMLTKEPNLCHGTTGNGLALEEPQRSHFLSFGTPEMIEQGFQEKVLQRSSDNGGVIWGEASRAWGWMMLLHRGGDALVDIGFPGFTNP